MAKKRTKRVAICLITNGLDEVLMGLRNDNGKYTCPGGHLDQGEDPYEGAIRELKEETGLDVEDIKLVKVHKTEFGTLIYCFKVEVDPKQLVDVSDDPDQECDDWFFMDPNEVIDELHVPLKDNVALKYWANN